MIQSIVWQNHSLLCIDSGGSLFAIYKKVIAGRRDFIKQKIVIRVGHQVRWYGHQVSSHGHQVWWHDHRSVAMVIRSGGMVIGQ